MSGWPLEVLGDVGDEPVLAEHDDDVLRREEKAREVGAVDARPAPVAGDRGEDVVAVAEEGVVAALHLRRVQAAPAQEERDLLARAWRASSSSYSVGRCTRTARGTMSRHYAASRVSRWSSGPTRSGVIERCSMLPSWPASSCSASA